MTYTIHHRDALEVLRGLPASSVDLVLTDPPYYRVKGDWWDRQWDTADGFLAWIDSLAAEWARVLKPNGSLYVFASPKMAARVEVTIGRRLNVLNRIRWMKSAGWHQKAEKDALRSFLSPWEEIIFAEHFGADNAAKGEAGYAAKCDEARGFVFEPLLRYLVGELRRSGRTRGDVDRHFATANVSQYWFQPRGFIIPTRERYEGLRLALNGGPLPDVGGYLRREYEDLRREYEDLRREYEDLRREYEDLRRPFAVTVDVPYTDVWDFPTVQARKGKHPCEKPPELLRHIIRASSRPGAVVLDSFAGSGNTGRVAVEEGRHFIGSEIDPHWHAYASANIATARAAKEPAASAATPAVAPVVRVQLALAL